MDNAAALRKRADELFREARELRQAGRTRAAAWSERIAGDCLRSACTLDARDCDLEGHVDRAILIDTDGTVWRGGRCSREVRINDRRA
jgi:hypothetical protein